MSLACLETSSGSQLPTALFGSTYRDPEKGFESTLLILEMIPEDISKGMSQGVKGAVMKMH